MVSDVLVMITASEDGHDQHVANHYTSEAVMMSTPQRCDRKRCAHHDRIRGVMVNGVLVMTALEV
jgi:hypothetical protein